MRNVSASAPGFAAASVASSRSRINVNGALALVGSGEYLPQMQSLEAALIDDAVQHGKERRYIQIPTAAGRESADRLDYWRTLGAEQGRRIGVETTFLPVLSREHADDAHLASQIENTALVYMSGGDPRYLAETLRGTRVGGAIEAHWRSGGALAGCSAGAMVMGRHVPSFRLRFGEPTEGLNLTPGIQILPHFNRIFELAFKGSSSEGVLLGIENLTALVKMSGSDRWRVEGEGAVHILSGLPKRLLRPGEEIQL